MQLWLKSFWNNARASYWFIPSFFSICSVIIAILLVEFDKNYDDRLIPLLPNFLLVQPEGARALLSTLGSSIINVTGTIFSVAMAAAVYASGTYGPRILQNFMTDRGNQLTLGVFTATFLYVLIVQRSIRAGGDNSIDQIEAFVPIIASFCSLLLGIFCMFVLIFFIHHAASNIYIVNVVDGIGRRLIKAVDTRFPNNIGQEIANEDIYQQKLQELPDCFKSDQELKIKDDEPLPYVEIKSNKAGYIEIFDAANLMRVAQQQDLIIKFYCRPGSFVSPNQSLYEVWPRENVDHKTYKRLLNTVSISARRSDEQDMLFSMDELGEIAVRTLAPGGNSYTAVLIIDWLAVVMAKIAVTRFPGNVRFDGENNIRALVEPASFADYMNHTFGNLRQYASKDKIAVVQYLKGLIRIAQSCSQDDEKLNCLRNYGMQLMGMAKNNLPEILYKEVEEEYDRFLSVLINPDHCTRIDQNSARA